ncbi:MAG: response regulator transcription factor [Rhizobiales bacterium]|nr:response regulator transcription factor [Hyphomicrobiales bacterium]NRB15859.1 response regulator transcription factor [Hyphomicrobiales bacterium]
MSNLQPPKFEKLNKQTIVIIDDDELIRTSIAELLFENGFNTIELSSGIKFEETFTTTKIDLALIDLRLIGESGQELSQKITENFGTPIIMVSGTGDDIDKIVSLETGADDYIMKPFNPRELVARVRAVLRRYNTSGQGSFTETQSLSGSADIIHFNEYSIDLKKRRLVKNNGAEITLTNSEFKLLEYFVLHPNIIIKREVLLEHLGCDTSEYVDRTIDVHILRLRRKIEPEPTKPIHLHTRRGKGYIFINDNVK